SDPMFTQIAYHQGILNEDESPYRMKFLVEHHTHHFTFGENIGNEDCSVPTFNIDWIPTRQPICLDHWKPRVTEPGSKSFTSVMNWSVQPDLVYAGEKWGQKNVEFERFIDIPSRFPSATFEIMVSGITPEKKMELQSHGWKVS